jgi:polar amino acid transport system substrate-binding protein
MQTLLWLMRLGLASCLVTGGVAQAATLQQVLNRSELRVGVTLAPPWAMRDDDGEYSGFEIEVARKLAADMGVELRFSRYEYDELVRALERGDIDIIIAGLTITPERALHVNFSQPYAVGGIGMATNVGATAEVERFEDLDDPAFAVAVIADSVAATLAERVLGSARIVPFRSTDQAADALVSGEVDVYLDEDPMPYFLELEHPGVVDVPLSSHLLETRAAFAVGKGDPDFVVLLNAWIEAREADTWLPTTHRYWFRSLQWQQ